MRSRLYRVAMSAGLMMTLLVSWALATPRYGAPDEPAHTVKAWATADGQTIGLPDELPLVRVFYVPLVLGSGDPLCFAFNPNATANCAQVLDDRSIGGVSSTAGTYPPFYYASVGVGAKALGADVSVMAMRLLSAAAAAALLGVALVGFSHVTARGAVFALMALTPMAWFMMAAVNPTALEISGMLAVWALLGAAAAARGPLRSSTFTAVGILSAVLVLARPVTLPWLVLAGGVFVALSWPRLPRRRDEQRRIGFALGAPMAIAIVASVAWSRYANVALTDDKFASDASWKNDLRTALGRTDEVFRQTFGKLGWLDTVLPTPAFWLWVASLGLTLSAVALLGTPLLRRTACVVIGCWLLYPIAYVVATGTPTVWSGRYNLPVLGGVALLAAFVARQTMTEAQVSRTARFVAVAFVIAEVLSFHQTLRRFMVGADGSILLRNPAWQPPLSAYALLAVNLVAASAVAVVAWRLPAPATDGQST